MSWVGHDQVGTIRYLVKAHIPDTDRFNGKQLRRTLSYKKPTLPLKLRSLPFLAMFAIMKPVYEHVKGFFLMSVRQLMDYLSSTDAGEGKGGTAAGLFPVETKESHRYRLVSSAMSRIPSSFSYPDPTSVDLVRKYRETSESDGRQIRQLDVERSEAIYAKNKMEHQQKILSSALETVRKESEMYSKALVDKEAEFASYRSSHVSVVSGREDMVVADLKQSSCFAVHGATADAIRA